MTLYLPCLQPFVVIAAWPFGLAIGRGPGRPPADAGAAEPRSFLAARRAAPQRRAFAELHGAKHAVQSGSSGALRPS